MFLGSWASTATLLTSVLGAMMENNEPSALQVPTLLVDRSLEAKRSCGSWSGNGARIQG